MKFLTQRKSLVLGASFAAMAAALTAVTPVYAAETTATLQGHVSSAAAGSKVTVVNANTGERVEGTVRSDGSYVIVGLRPSTYHVTAGASTQDITLTVGETTTLDIDAAAAAAPAQDVVVTGRRREVRTSTVSTSVSQTQIDRLPQLDRNFMNFAALAPGVSVSTDPNNKTFKAGGTPASQVNVFIDGQSQKNQVLQGGTTGQDSSRGNPFPQLAVQEFKVSTQNFTAEYEQAGTAIITAVTKTGGNEFHGDIFDEIESKAMSGQPYYDRLAGTPKPDYHRSQYGMDLGGPIIKDKLHFYVAYEGDDELHPSVAVSMPTIPTNAGLNSYLQSLNGTFPDPYNEQLLFGKLTWDVTDADTVDLSYFRRTESNQQAFGGITAYSAGSNLDQFTYSEVLTWKHRGDNWLNEVNLEKQAYHWRQSNTSTSPAIALVYTGNDQNVFANIGGPESTQLKSQDNTTFKDTFTYTGWDWHGHHVIKAGVKYAGYKYHAAENEYNYYYDANTYVVGGNNIPIAAKVDIGDPDFVTQNNQWGLFIQDDWTVDSHLELNLGVRWDYESNMLNDKYVTPTAVAAAIRGFTNFKNGGFNPEDYISNGSNRHPVKDMFAPRLGLSYDINGDRTTVIFAGAGRYYDRTINDYVQLEQRRAYSPQTTLHFCSATSLLAQPVGTDPLNPGCINWSEAYRSKAGLQALSQTGEIYALNNNTKVPYNDQLDIGVRHQFGPVNASVTLSQITGHNLFAWVLGNRNPDGSWCSYGPQYDCQPWSYGLPGYGNFLISDDNGKSNYQAIYVQVEKPYTRSSHYGYTGALTLTNAKNNGNQGEYAFDYENQEATGMHPSPVDKIRFVGTGIIDGPWDTQLSGIVTLASGSPFDSIDNSGPALLYTPTALYPKNKLAYKDVDLRISKDFDLDNGQVVTFDAQVYNVFDWVNKTYSGWGGGFNGGTGATRAGDNATTGTPRTFQMGLKYKF